MQGSASGEESSCGIWCVVKTVYVNAVEATTCTAVEAACPLASRQLVVVLVGALLFFSSCVHSTDPSVVLLI